MKKDILQNYIKLTIPAKSMNEGLSRSVISAFISQLDPTIEELCDLKTAVSEAVTNCIVHAYKDEPDDRNKLIYITASITKDGLATIRIRDKGCGIGDIERALTPMYSGSDSEERSGMGFSIMQVFSDKLTVKSKIGKGTIVSISKQIGNNHAED